MDDIEKKKKNKKDKAVCPHLVRIVSGICSQCRRNADGDPTSFVPFRYIDKDYTLPASKADELRKSNTTSLLTNKKLILILDIDNTLLHTTMIQELPKNLRPAADGLKHNPDSGFFRFGSCMTKLRPFVRTFLREASDMFEMYLYTMGERSYALEMAEILDPRHEFFDRKVISRKDSTTPGQKGLDVVLGEERVVVVIDDSRKVWKRHLRNLIQVEGYYFSGRDDDDDGDGVLAKTLGLLKKLHVMFFDTEIDTIFSSRDVRDLIKKIPRIIM